MDSTTMTLARGVCFVVCGVWCVVWCVCVGGGGWSEVASWWSNACDRATPPKRRVNWRLPVCGEANVFLMCCLYVAIARLR